MTATNQRGWRKHMLPQSHVKPNSASFQGNVTHLEESAIRNLLHTWPHRRPWFDRASVIDRREREYPIPPTLKAWAVLLPWLPATGGCGIARSQISNLQWHCELYSVHIYGRSFGRQCFVIVSHFSTRRRQRLHECFSATWQAGLI